MERLGARSGPWVILAERKRLLVVMTVLYKTPRRQPAVIFPSCILTELAALAGNHTCQDAPIRSDHAFTLATRPADIPHERHDKQCQDTGRNHRPDQNIKSQ